MRNYPTLHLDTNQSKKKTDCSKKGYGFKNEHEKLSNFTLRHKLK